MKVRDEELKEEAKKYSKEQIKIINRIIGFRKAIIKELSKLWDNYEELKEREEAYDFITDYCDDRPDFGKDTSYYLHFLQIVKQKKRYEESRIEKEKKFKGNFFEFNEDLEECEGGDD